MGLVGLWLVSLFLAGVALLIMAGLILSHVLRQRRRAILASERKRLVPLLLEAPRSDEHFADVPPASRLLTEVSTELIQLVRGADKATFVASARRLGVPQRLRLDLARASVAKRITAAEALSDFPDRASGSALLAALDDPHADVRLAAAVALAASERAPPIAHLIEKLRVGTEERSMLITDLFENIARARPKEVRALIEEPSTPAAVRGAAIEALAATGDYRLIPHVLALTEAAGGDSAELPRYLRALGQFGHPSAATVVRSHLASPHAWIRSAAAEAAGKIGMTEAAVDLADLLDDEDWWVRFRTGEALARLGGTGRELLVERSRHGSARSREAAALTLAERGIPA